MATHQISKHTINLKQEEFSTSLLLKNILREHWQLRQTYAQKLTQY